MEKVERLQKAYKYLHDNKFVRSKAHMAKLMGRERSNVSAAISGREPFFNDSFLRSVSAAFPCLSPDWLINGIGDMVVPTESATRDSADDGGTRRGTEQIGAMNLVELSAHLIQEIESIRRELTAQMKLTADLNSRLVEQVSMANILSTRLESQVSRLTAMESGHGLAPRYSTSPSIGGPNASISYDLPSAPSLVAESEGDNFNETKK